MLLQMLISSLALGSVYSLIAMAMVIVYKTTDIPNFAQGEMALLATYLCYSMTASLHLPFAFALVLALLGAALLGLVFHLLIRRKGAQGRLGPLLLTLGLQFLLQGLTGWIWGPQPRQCSLPLDATATWHWGSLAFARLDLVALALTLSVAMLLLFFYRSKWGIATRAAQQNPNAARFNGVPVDRLQALAWMMSAVVGALAGILLAPMTALDPSLMWDPALKGFAAAVLGGMRSLSGALLAGFVLAIGENLFATYVAADFKTVLALSTIVVVLTLRPQGLLGRERGRRV